MPGHARAAIRAMEARYRRLKAAHRDDEAEVYRLVEPADTTRYLSIQNYTDNTLNVCLEATYRFIDTVVDEIAQLHESAGVPLKTFHLGADETAGAWRDSPACAALQNRTGRTIEELAPYFIERVAMSLAGRGLKVAGWSDGLGHTHPARMPPAVQTHVWGTLFWGGIAEAHEQTNRGWDTVLSIPDFAYFDMPYVPHPLEGGNPWATRSVDTLQVFAFQTENLAANAPRVLNRYGQAVALSSDPPLQPGKAYVGIQAQIWTEAIRSEVMLHHQLFPRLLAFAERAWYRPIWEVAYAPGQIYQAADPRVDESAMLDSWRVFRGRMPTHFRLMEQLGVAYRLTPPGARLVNGELQALGEYPGLDIEYRAKGSSRWQRYMRPVTVSGAVELRTRSLNRRRSSRIVTVGATDGG
jgi:hexosaminidase